MIRNEDWSTMRRLLFMHRAAGGALKEYEVEGNPAVFQTNVAKPLSGFTIPFYPIQTGSGDPSPQNHRPIIGRQGVTAVRSGLNMFNFDSSKIETVKNSSGNNRSAYRLGFTNCTLTFSATPKTEGIRTPTAINITKFVNERAQTGASAFLKDSGEEIVTFEVGAGEEVVLLLAKNDNAELATDLQLYDIQIELGSTASTFTEYTGDSYPVTFPTIIYGGTVDVVNRVLLLEWVKALLDDADAWAQSGSGSTFLSYVGYSFNNRKMGSSWNLLCPFFPASQASSGTAYIRWGGTEAGNILVAPNGSSLTVNDLKTMSENKEIYIVYPLATSIEVPLSSLSVPVTLKGDNTVWTDTNGSNTIKYKKKG